MQTDILLLGATGFTGRLIARYLAAHPQRSQFTFTLSARSTRKLKELVKSLGLGADIPLVEVDVLNNKQVEEAVKAARVVINTVGPFTEWGTPVVRACAVNGIHYVDLSGETPWIKDMITKYDYLCTKTGAVIVPACGMDSIPSDISVFLSNLTASELHETKKETFQMSESVTGHLISGGMSGGTISSALGMLENIPFSKLKSSYKPYATSPIVGPSKSSPFIREVQVPGSRSMVGAWFFLGPSNQSVVERTFGLLELQARTADPSQAVTEPRYGSEFKYEEYLVMPNKKSAAVFLLTFSITAFLVIFVSPLRWLFKQYMPKPGEGPSESSMQNGSIVTTNITTAISDSGKRVKIKSMLKGKGDPGYLLTSVMITEAALCLVLPPVAWQHDLAATPAKTKHAIARRALPALARQGGVLTPMTAFGSVLIDRLERTGRFQFESRVVKA